MYIEMHASHEPSIMNANDRILLYIKYACSVNRLHYLIAVNVHLRQLFVGELANQDWANNKVNDK